jgi:hypothetical protein
MIERDASMIGQNGKLLLRRPQNFNWKKFKAGPS